MNIDWSKAPEGATHYSEGVNAVYWPSYWKEGPYGCWAFVLDGRKTPKWTFHRDLSIPPRAKPIGYKGLKVTSK